MVTHIWRRRRTEGAPDTTESEPTGSPSGRRVFTRREPVQAVPQTVLVDRRTARRWRGRRPNPVSATIWIATWVAVLILLLGILLTWANANPDNEIFRPILRAGNWLATPFHDAFLNPDPEQRLYANWGVAAGVYLLIGRVLSWLVRW